MLTNNGIDEQWFPHEIGLSDGKPLFSIQDIRFWLNQHAPFPSLRLSSWRGSARLSIDWSSVFQSEELIQKYMQQVIDFTFGFSES